MVEPQVPGVSAHMQYLRQANDELMLQQAANLPQELIARSEKRVVAYYSLKAELNADLGKVQEQFDAVIHKFKANLHSGNRENGLLFQREQDYLDCL